MTADSARSIEQTSRESILLHGGQKGLISGLEETLKILPFKVIESSFLVTREMERTQPHVQHVQRVREDIGIQGLKEYLRTTEGRIELAQKYFPEAHKLFSFGGAGLKDVFYSGNYATTTMDKILAMEHANPLLSGEPYQMFWNEDYIQSEMDKANLTPNFRDELKKDHQEFGRGLSKEDYARSVAIPCNVNINGDTYVIGIISLNMLDKSKLDIPDDQPVPQELVNEAYDLMQGLTFPLAAVADSVIGQYLFENEQKARKELQEAQAEKIRAAKMDTTLTFVNGAMHSFNNELYPVHSQADGIQSMIEAYMSSLTQFLPIVHGSDATTDFEKYNDLIIEQARSSPKHATELNSLKREIRKHLKSQGIQKDRAIATLLKDLELPLERVQDFVEAFVPYDLEKASAYYASLFRLERSAGYISSGTQQLSDRLTALRKLLRGEQEKGTVSDLHASLDEIIKTQIESNADYSINVTSQYDGNIMQAGISMQHLRDTFGELLKNAADAMNGEGKITVRTYEQKDDGVYTVISVQDNGCGMDAEVMDRIFDMHYTTKGSQNTGLGLAQTWFIMNQVYDGKVEVQSMPGEGTTFELYIPTTIQERGGG